VEYSISLGAVVLPPARPEILIDPNPARQVGAGGKVWEDQGQMSGLSDHRIVTIAATLTISTGMHMDVGYNHHVQLAARLPHRSECSAVELDKAVREAGRVNVVVIEESPYLSNFALDVAEKKGTAFTLAYGAPPQFIDALTPQSRIAD
jgi:hypothetical protein